MRGKIFAAVLVFAVCMFAGGAWAGQNITINSDTASDVYGNGKLPDGEEPDLGGGEVPRRI